MGDIVIYFYDRDTIKVTDGKSVIIYNKWFCGRKNKPEGWRMFTTKLQLRRKITMKEIAQLAIEADVNVCVSHYPMVIPDNVPRV